MSSDNTQAGAIREQASAWFELLRSNQASHQDVISFNRWLSESVDHQKAFEKIDALWLISKDIKNTSWFVEEKKLVERLKAEAVKEKNIIDLMDGREDSGNASADQKFCHTRSWKVFAGFAMAASIALVTAAIWLFDGGDNLDAVRYVTRTGEQKTVNLPDGSVIILNTKSAIDVKYDKISRNVTLLRGQANFQISKDRHRTFVVNVGRGSVAALGTEFDIYKAEPYTMVTLMQGAVRVAWNESDETPPTVNLEPGQQIRISDNEGLSVVSTVDLRRITDWQNGILNYDETLLSEAIAEANRYTELKLELGDQALANIPVTGRFVAGENTAFARALANLYDVTLHKVSHEKILIRQGKHSEK